MSRTHHTLNFEMDVLQQQKTTSGSPPASQQQQSEAIMGTDSVCKINALMCRCTSGCKEVNGGCFKYINYIIDANTSHN